MSNKNFRFIVGAGIGILALFIVQLWTSGNPLPALVIFALATTLLLPLVASNPTFRRFLSGMPRQTTLSEPVRLRIRTSNRLQGSSSFSDDYDAEDNPDLPPAAPLAHALTAIKSAHAAPQTLSDSLLTDIGFIASWDMHTAHTYRTTPIPNSAKALQPYAQMRLRHTGLWQFSFEILDFGGKLLFKREVSTYLDEGRHLIMPPARQPVREVPRVGVWTLRFSVNGELLALHRFTWTNDLVEGYIESDGEIDETYLQRMEESPTAHVSIDELLSAPKADKPRTLPP